MTQDEFMEYVRQNRIDLRKYNVIVGEKSNVPYAIGCYEEGKQWHLYGVGERQNCSIITSGDEKVIFQYLYFILCGRVSM